MKVSVNAAKTSSASIALVLSFPAQVSLIAIYEVSKLSKLQLSFVNK